MSGSVPNMFRGVLGVFYMTDVWDFTVQGDFKGGFSRIIFPWVFPLGAPLLGPEIALYSEIPDSRHITNTQKAPKHVRNTSGHIGNHF